MGTVGEKDKSIRLDFDVKRLKVKVTARTHGHIRTSGSIYRLSLECMDCFNELNHNYSHDTDDIFKVMVQRSRLQTIISKNALFCRKHADQQRTVKNHIVLKKRTH